MTALTPHGRRQLLGWLVGAIVLTFVTGELHRGALAEAGWPDGASTLGGTVPVGFVRQGSSMQGYASAVEWHGDYVYLGASTVLQTYYAPRDATPQLVHEIEVRDWIREMAIGNGTLFVAARGDGLLAFDLTTDPAAPTLVDRVSGMHTTHQGDDVEAVFNGVHAAGNRVAVARVNNVAKARGGVDAIVFDFDPDRGRLQPIRTLRADVRSNTAIEVPLTVGLTEDGGGLFIGYGVLTGELVYVSLDHPDAPAMHAHLGAPFDISTHGDVAFVAATSLCAAPGGCSMLSRVHVGSEALIEEQLLTHAGSAAGGSVDVDGDLLCFATWSPGRYEEGSNLWLFSDVLAETPTRRGTAGTPDWVFQIACRDQTTGPDTVFVADEWGGLEVWRADGTSLAMDLDDDRVATGALSEGLWNDGSRVYSVKRGAGLWAFDTSDLGGEHPIVEWIDRGDPGCSCVDCCPPATGPFPYPPAVFVGAGTSTKGRLAVLASDRNDAVPGAGYFMLFDEYRDTDDSVCVFSEPVEAWGGSFVTSFGDDFVLATTAAHTLRAYQHCPGRIDEVRHVADATVPGTGANMSITDAVVYEGLLFVAEVHDPPLSMPDNGAVHVFEWSGLDVACPARPSDAEFRYLGSFAQDVIARALAVDGARRRLVVGAASKPIFPVREGALLFYDLDQFDRESPAAWDDHRIVATVDEADRVTHANVHQLLVASDDLYVVDRDNGLYHYSLEAQRYVGFFPAHRGPESQAFVAELVRSPPGVVPLYHPVAVAALPNGQVVVHEHNSGRASLLRPAGPLHIPFVVR